MKCIGQDTSWTYAIPIFGLVLVCTKNGTHPGNVELLTEWPLWLDSKPVYKLITAREGNKTT